LIAVILAAGQGRRMGGPKALLVWKGESLLGAHLRAAREASCRASFGVVREEIAPQVNVAEGSSLIVSHRDDALGPAGSIAAFVESVSFAPDEAIALAPVDCIPDAWRALPLLARALTDEHLAARPLHATRRGHPVLVRGRVLDVYRHAAPPLRDVLRDLGQRVVDVPVDVAEVLTDLDTPSDVPPPHGRTSANDRT
jgi:CTP:molybdopterin cytidylyltransferase MocA